MNNEYEFADSENTFFISGKKERNWEVVAGAVGIIAFAVFMIWFATL